VGRRIENKARVLRLRYSFAGGSLRKRFRGGVEALRSGLQSGGDFLKRINTEEAVGLRGDREAAQLTRGMW
jgi:hypothetical protein